MYTPMSKWFGVVPLGFWDIFILLVAGFVFYLGYLIYALL